MSRRLQSIDFVRGLAIIFMVQGHLWEFFMAPPAGAGVHAHTWVVGPLGAAAAPLFTFISGVSAALAYHSLTSRGTTGGGVTIQYLKRGAALFLLATFVSAMTGPVLHVMDISVLNWSVIQLVGFCLCLVPLYARLGPPLRALWLAVPLAFTVVHPQSGPLLLLTTGFAPPLPWGFFFFAGTSVGFFYLSALQAPDSRRLAGLGAAGLFLLAPVGLALSRVVAPLSLAHWEGLTLTSISVFTGAFILLVAACGYWLDLRGARHRLIDATSGLGQHSLTAYYLQLFGIVLGAMVITRVTGRPPGLDFVWFLPLTVLVLLALHGAINIVWARHDYAFTPEWLIARWVRSGARAPQT
jgi:uncharacterized membrane protein